MSKKKGYALIITIIITLVLSLTSLTSLTIVYRYTSIVKDRHVALQDKITSDNNNYGVNNINISIHNR